jgi:2-hydroxychromene-2-carboxylate isomerase
MTAMKAADPTREPIRFYFDFISPYAYLGWTQIHALAHRYERKLEPVAVLFAAMLDANGTKGPAEIPSKRTYIFKDALRHAIVLGVPFAMPSSHPFNPLLGLRVASLPMADEVRFRLIDGLYKETWGGGSGITDPSVVATVATAAGLDGEAAVLAASLDEAKALVKANTAEAIALGVFGVPSVLVDGELFWGLDSFAHVERRLRGEDPITPEILAQLRDVQPSAVRPGSRSSS